MFFIFGIIFGYNFIYLNNPQSTPLKNGWLNISWYPLKPSLFVGSGSVNFVIISLASSEMYYSVGKAYLLA